MENTAPVCSSALEVTTPSMIWTPVLQRGNVIAHNLEQSSLRDLFRNLWASKSIRQDVPNLETTMKMNLPQPQAGSSNISKPSRRRSKVHRASYLWRRILNGQCAIRLGEAVLNVNGSCGRANAVAFCQSVWGNLHFHSIEMIQNGQNCFTWQVIWKSEFWAWYRHCFFSTMIWLSATSSLKGMSAYIKKMVNQ